VGFLASRITVGRLAQYEFLTQNFNMKTIQEIAQWVIDNRYPKSENNKVSDAEMYYTLVEAMNQVLRQPPVSESVCSHDFGDRNQFSRCRKCGII
jgi:hypothetical protein